MKLIRAALIAAVVALAISAAAAQSGGLTVRVLDEQGEPLPGATVTISSEVGYVKTTSELSNAKGFVDFPVLRPGQGYSIEVSFPGMMPVIETDIRVQIGQNQTLPIQLSPKLEERVTVTARSEVVDLEQSQASTRFSDDFISDLPVPGRFYQNVLTMAPGVQDADGDGNPNVHGSRSRDFKAIVGGLSNVDPLTGRFMSNVNPNSIEEMEVITAGAGVEFGRAQGGFARVIQKQGSNEHEGIFDFIFQSGKLDGDGAGDQSNLPDDTDFTTFTPGFQFSGPVIRDKLWYRASHEFRQIEDPRNVTNGFVVIKTDAATHSDQLTWQVSPRNKLAFKYNADPVEIAGFNASSLIPFEAATTFEASGDQYSMTWTAPYSPKLLVNTDIGWQDRNTNRYPTVTGIVPDCVAATGAEFLSNAQCFDIDSGQLSGSSNVTQLDHSQRLTAKSDVTMYGGRFWGMNHTFKFGLSVENERYFRDLTIRPFAQTVIITNPSEDDENSTDPERYGRIFTTLYDRTHSEVRAAGTVFGAYLQDQFKPRQNLSVSLGVRFDREEISSDGKQPLRPKSEFDDYFDFIDFNNNGFLDSDDLDPDFLNDRLVAAAQIFTVYEDATEFIDLITTQVCGTDLGCRETVGNSVLAQSIAQGQKLRRDETLEITNTNISPFVSLAWNPWNNGKTAFKASAGRHYNIIPLIIPLIELNPANTQVAQNFSVPCPENANCLTGSNRIEPAVNISTVDRGLRTPFQDEFTLTFEREIFTETRMSLQYINRQYKDQIQDRNINVDVGDFGRCQTQTNQSVSPIDTSQGPDGILDDCVGMVERITTPDGPGGSTGFGSGMDLLRQPDGVPDLYTQNPLWGDVFLIGNFNEAEYEAFVLEIVRRQYRSWEMSGSYTWSELFGDGEDFFQALGDDPSLRGDEQGYQSNDQRHVVKLNATTITPWGIRLGTTLSWQSGLPFSLLRRQFSYDTLPPLNLSGVERRRLREIYPSGARNDERNRSYWDVNVKATKEMNVGRGMNLQVSAEIFNLFNDDTYTIYNPGAEFGRQINGNNEAYRRFGREWQLGMKLQF